jgi:hypothetical protein
MAVRQMTEEREARDHRRAGLRRFEFERDSFAFANELVWEYRFDARGAQRQFTRPAAKPTYTHRCFVMARAARQFLYHARFEAALPAAAGETYRQLIRQVLARDPRVRAAPGREILIPGCSGLRQFSREGEALLKAECGGAWRSYVLRSHWRMVFPITRAHQAWTAARLAAAIDQHEAPIVHLASFPRLAINHGMVLFDRLESAEGIEFAAYDPNEPKEPARLLFERGARTFHLPPNRYWAGGALNIIEIYRTWLL